MQRYMITLGTSGMMVNRPGISSLEFCHFLVTNPSYAILLSEYLPQYVNNEISNFFDISGILETRLINLRF